MFTVQVPLQFRPRGRKHFTEPHEWVDLIGKFILMPSFILFFKHMYGNFEIFSFFLDELEDERSEESCYSINKSIHYSIAFNYLTIVTLVVFLKRKTRCQKKFPAWDAKLNQVKNILL